MKARAKRMITEFTIEIKIIGRFVYKMGAVHQSIGGIDKNNESAP